MAGGSPSATPATLLEPSLNTSRLRQTDVATISNALNLVKSLRGVSFTRIETGRRGIGVIAQELAAVVPEAVQANDDGLLSVAYGNLVGVLIEAVKELANKVERLEARALWPLPARK